MIPSKPLKAQVYVLYPEFQLVIADAWRNNPTDRVKPAQNE